MAEDREDGSPGDEEKQFGLLGEVEGWDGQSNEATASEDVILIDSSASEDVMAKEASTSKDAPSKLSSVSEDVILIDSSGSEDEMAKEASTSKDAPSKLSSASKDVQSFTGSAVKRKSNNPGAQEPEAKEMKLSSEKEDDKGLPNVEEIEVASKEYCLAKFRCVNISINLSEQLMCESDYRGWVQKERKDGMVFPVFDPGQPVEIALLSFCDLVSGYEKGSNNICLGFARGEKVIRFSAFEAKYVPTVRNTVKAFEEMAHSNSKPLFEPNTRQGYWHGIGVITNSKDETLLRVDIYAADKYEGENRFVEAKDILVKYFSSEGPAVDCHVRSIYLRILIEKINRFAKKIKIERKAATCITDNKFIVETLGGMKVKLYPWSLSWKCTPAINYLCEAMLKVLLLERCKTVVELGCGNGIIGQFLAKHCESVLGVDTPECIAEARVNADENHLSNCTYFSQNTLHIWPTLSDALQDKPPAMVIVNAVNNFAVDDPVFEWLTRSSKVCRVVYVKMTKTTPKSKVVILCTPTKEVKKNHDDPMTYFPLYVLPVDLGGKFVAVTVLQHVESNFIYELYKPRQNYTMKCIRIVTSTYGYYMAEDDPREKIKHIGKNNGKKKVFVSKPYENITYVKNVARGTGRTRVSRWDGLGVSKSGQQPLGDCSNPTDADHTADSSNVSVNKAGMLTTHINASKDFRNVLQSRSRRNHIPGLFDRMIPLNWIENLKTVSQKKMMHAERLEDVTNHFKEEKFIDEIIHDRNRKILDSILVQGVVPPRTEDFRQVLKEKMIKNIAGDRNERIGEFYGRGQARGHENYMRSFIEENRVTHKNEGKDSFTESSRLPHDAETWDGTRKGLGFRDGHDLYPADIWGKLSQLVEDNELFERGLDSKINRDGRRKGSFADIQDMRSIEADLSGSGPSRSFDDAELDRRKPRTDGIASGITTDARGINIRVGGQKSRDDTHNMESIHDAISKIEAYLSYVKSSMKDFQHSGKERQEFNQSFSNAGTKSVRHTLSPNLKLHVMGDTRRENSYHNDKPNYFGEVDKSSKAERFAFDERRAKSVIAERNWITFVPESNRITFGETDRNRTHIDQSERNRVVGESVSKRKIVGGPERSEVSYDGPNNWNRNMFDRAEDRKRQVLETGDRNKQVFSEPNTDRLMFGGSEDRDWQLYDGVEDRIRSVYGELENRKRHMYIESDDRTRLPYAGLEKRKKLIYSDPEDMKRLVHSEPVDSKRLKYGELEDKRSVYEKPEDRRRSVYGAPEDRSGNMFSKTDDRNLPVTEKSKPVVEVGQNTPNVKEIELNRLMADVKELGIVLYTTDYNRDYAEDRHSFNKDESAGTNFSSKDTCSRTSQSQENISPKIQPVEASQLPPKAEDSDKEASKRHHQQQQQQHFPIPLPPPPPPLLTDKQMVEIQSNKEKARKIKALKTREVQQSVCIQDMQAGGSSFAKGKYGKTYIEESSVKNNNAKNLHLGDRVFEMGSQAYRAVDRSREPAASHQTHSSLNREWDKVQSSGGYSSTALWASSWGQEGRQRDTEEFHGTFRSLQQPVDAKQTPPLFSQHVGKYETSDVPGRSTLSSLSTFRQSPQNYGHLYQQYGSLGSIPAQPSAVGMGDMSQSSSWQGGGPGSWNTSRGWSTTGEWGTPGAWNTSNNRSSQSGNAGYTWR